MSIPHRISCDSTSASASGAVGGGSYVPEDQLADALARCEAANAGEPITVFEITTAAALLLFSEAQRTCSCSKWASAGVSTPPT